MCFWYLIRLWNYNCWEKRLLQMRSFKIQLPCAVIFVGWTFVENKLFKNMGHETDEFWKEWSRCNFLSTLHILFPRSAKTCTFRFVMQNAILFFSVEFSSFWFVAPEEERHTNQTPSDDSFAGSCHTKVKTNTTIIATCQFERQIYVRKEAPWDESIILLSTARADN